MLCVIKTLEDHILFIFSFFDLSSEFWVILDGVIVPALSVEHVEYGNNTYGY